MGRRGPLPRHVPHPAPVARRRNADHRGHGATTSQPEAQVPLRGTCNGAPSWRWSEEARRRRRPSGGNVEPGRHAKAYVLAVELISILFAAFVGFRLVLRQDERRWSRERRADVYVDLLVEATAERDWLSKQLTDAEVGESSRDVLPDDRMPSRERRLLDARLAAFSSPEVLRRHNQFNTVGMQLLGIQQHDAAGVKVQVDFALDALQRQIRHELETERLTWWRRLRRPKNAPESKIPLTTRWERDAARWIASQAPPGQD